MSRPRSPPTLPSPSRGEGEDFERTTSGGDASYGFSLNSPSITAPAFRADSSNLSPSKTPGGNPSGDQGRDLDATVSRPILRLRGRALAGRSEIVPDADLPRRDVPGAPRQLLPVHGPLVPRELPIAVPFHPGQLPDGDEVAGRVAIIDVSGSPQAPCEWRFAPRGFPARARRPKAASRFHDGQCRLGAARGRKPGYWPRWTNSCGGPGPLRNAPARTSASRRSARSARPSPAGNQRPGDPRGVGRRGRPRVSGLTVAGRRSTTW